MSLTLESISFRYEGGPALLDEASLDVGPGQSVAVMAPSGAGKSTALAIAGLLLAPHGGKVLHGGQEVHARGASRRLGSTVAWLPQTVSLLPRRTVIDNVMLAALSRGADRTTARVEAERRLRSVELAEMAVREARTLSGGEAQRVGIARAMVSGPGLLIADEPTASLDGATALRVARALLTATAGTTLLLATHDASVAALADRVVVLSGGVFHEEPR